VILVIIIRQKVESVGSSADPYNRVYLMPLLLVFKQGKAHLHR
jgi:hypothetical protein